MLARLDVWLNSFFNALKVLADSANATAYLQWALFVLSFLCILFIKGRAENFLENIQGKHGDIQLGVAGISFVLVVFIGLPTTWFIFSTLWVSFDAWPDKVPPSIWEFIGFLIWAPCLHWTRLIWSAMPLTLCVYLLELLGASLAKKENFSDADEVIKRLGQQDGKLREVAYNEVPDGLRGAVDRWNNTVIREHIERLIAERMCDENGEHRMAYFSPKELKEAGLLPPTIQRVRQMLMEWNQKVIQQRADIDAWSKKHAHLIQPDEWHVVSKLLRTNTSSQPNQIGFRGEDPALSDAAAKEWHFRPEPEGGH